MYREYINKYAFFILISIVGAGSNFLGNIISASILSVNDFSQLSIYFSLQSLLAVIVGLNYSVSVVRVGIRNDDYILRKYITYAIQLTFIACAISIPIVLYIDQYENIYGVIIVINSGLLACISLFNSINIFKGDLKSYIFNQLICLLVPWILFIPILNLYNSYKSKILLDLFFMTLLLYYILSKKNIKIHLVGEYKLYKNLIRNGAKLMVHSMSLPLYMYLIREILYKYSGQNEVAKFSLMITIVGSVGLLFEAFNKLYISWLYNEIKIKSINFRKLVKLTKLGLLFSLLTVPIIFFIVREFYHLFISKNYFLTNLELLLYLSSAYLNIFYFIFINILFYCQKNYTISFISLISIIIDIAIVMIFVKNYGILAVIISQLVVKILQILLIISVAKSQIKHETKIC